MNIFNLLLDLGLLSIYYNTKVESIDIEVRSPPSFTNFCQYQIIVCLLTEDIGTSIPTIKDALMKTNCKISDDEINNSVYHIRNALKQDLKKLVIGTYNLKVDPNDAGRLLCPEVNETVTAAVRSNHIQPITVENCKIKLQSNILSVTEANGCIKIYEAKIKEVEKNIANTQTINNFKELDLFKEPENVDHYSDEEKELLLDAIESQIRGLATIHGVYVPKITGSNCHETSKRSNILSQLKPLEDELKLLWVSSKSTENKRKVASLRTSKKPSKSSNNTVGG